MTIDHSFIAKSLPSGIDTPDLKHDTSMTLAAASKQEAELRAQAGISGRLQANRELRGKAREALVQTGAARIQGIREIQETAIGLTVASIKAAMASRALPTLGSLVTQLNLASSAVDRTLTQCFGAELVGHLQARQANLDGIRRLAQDGSIAPEEMTLLSEAVAAQCNADLERAGQRQRLAKENVMALHQSGLNRIQRSKDALTN